MKSWDICDDIFSIICTRYLYPYEKYSFCRVSTHWNKIINDTDESHSTLSSYCSVWKQHFELKCYDCFLQ